MILSTSVSICPKHFWIWLNFIDCPKHLLNIAEFGRLAKTNIRWPHIWMRHILSYSSSKIGENKAYFFQTESIWANYGGFCLKTDKMASSSKETGKNTKSTIAHSNGLCLKNKDTLFLKRKRIEYVSSMVWPICQI